MLYPMPETLLVRPSVWKQRNLRRKAALDADKALISLLQAELQAVRAELAVWKAWWPPAGGIIDSSGTNNSGGINEKDCINDSGCISSSGGKTNTDSSPSASIPAPAPSGVRTWAKIAQGD